MIYRILWGFSWRGFLLTLGRAVFGALKWGAFTVVLLLLAERFLDALDPYPTALFDAHPESRRVESADGATLRILANRNGERLLRVRIEDVSPHLIHALLAAEDGDFRRHSGVNFAAGIRAVAQAAARFRIVSGASTLTMQLARQLEPHPRSLAAKAYEMFRARQIERLLTKDEILERYLNVVPMGGVVRGVEAGSRRWFGKPCARLEPHEAAMLVAMLPAPSRLSPERAADELRRRRDRVLAKMEAAGYLDPAVSARALAMPLGASRHDWPLLAPHAADLALRTSRDIVVRTDIDLGVQRAVETAVAARPATGVDGIAAVVLERTGAKLKALVGSDDYLRRPLNAATARRSSGSTLKPFLYAQAIDAGLINADSLLIDRPTRYGAYRPANFSEDFSGRIRAADALAESRNVPAVRLLDALGLVPFQALLLRLGLEADRPLGLDAALGTVAVSPLELARAYAGFAAADPTIGLRAEAVKDVLDALSTESPDPTRIVPGLVAWKTGTSSGRRDAWSVGVTKRHVIVVWQGRHDGRAAPELVGRTTAAPIVAQIAGALGN